MQWIIQYSLAQPNLITSKARFSLMFCEFFAYFQLKSQQYLMLKNKPRSFVNIDIISVEIKVQFTCWILFSLKNNFEEKQIDGQYEVIKGKALVNKTIKQQLFIENDPNRGQNFKNKIELLTSLKSKGGIIPVGKVVINFSKTDSQDGVISQFLQNCSDKTAKISYKMIVQQRKEILKLMKSISSSNNPIKLAKNHLVLNLSEQRLKQLPDSAIKEVNCLKREVWKSKLNCAQGSNSNQKQEANQTQKTDFSKLKSIQKQNCTFQIGNLSKSVEYKPEQKRSGQNNIQVRPNPLQKQQNNRTNLQQYKIQINNLKNQNLLHVKKIEQSKKQYQQIIQQNKKLVLDNRKLASAIRTIESQFTQYKSIIEQTLTSLTKWNPHTSSMSPTSFPDENIQHLINEFQLNLSSLIKEESKKSRLRQKEYEKLCRELSCLKQQQQSKDKCISTVEQTLKGYRQKNKSYNEQLLKKRRQVKEYQQCIVNKEEEIISLKQFQEKKIKNLNQALTSKNKEIESLKMALLKIPNSPGQQQDNNACYEQNSTLKAEIRNCQEQKQKLLKLVYSEKQKSQRLLEKIQANEQQSQQREMQNYQQRERLQLTLAAANAKNEELLQKVSDLEDENNTISKQMDKTMVSQTKTKQQINKIVKQKEMLLETYSSQSKQLEDKAATLTQQNSIYRQELQQLQIKVQRIERARTSETLLRKKSYQLAISEKKQLDIFKLNFDEIKKNISKLQRDKRISSTALNSLLELLAKMQEIINKIEKNVGEQIKDYQQNYKDDQADLFDMTHLNPLKWKFTKDGQFLEA